MLLFRSRTEPDLRTCHPKIGRSSSTHLVPTTDFILGFYHLLQSTMLKPTGSCFHLNIYAFLFISRTDLLQRELEHLGLTKNALVSFTSYFCHPMVHRSFLVSKYSCVYHLPFRVSTLALTLRS